MAMSGVTRKLPDALLTLPSLGAAKPKKLTKDQISNPTNFEHREHASREDMEEFMARLEAEAEHSTALQRSRFDVDLASLRVSLSSDEISFGGSSPTPTSELAAVEKEERAPLAAAAEPPSPPSSSSAHSRANSTGSLIIKDVDVDGLPFLTPDEIEAPPFTLQTVEKVTSAKVWIENYFVNLMRGHYERESRRQRLDDELARSSLENERKQDMRRRLFVKETDYMRLRRLKVSRAHFEDVKTIGRGAFGVVKLVRERETGNLLAMKCLNKAEMIKKRQEGHVRAERDLLAAATDSRSIVRLFHSFQDKDNLYLVMEYMGGGDLLNLLIKMDIFPEDFARFYLAEMVLAISEVHALGFIHRDIKPDNFLFSHTGHLKVSDFGLCTGFHWTHDARFYESQRKASAKLLENRANELMASNAKTVQELMADDMEPRDRILFWRKQNRKSMAYSVVGTNNYIAPEVLLQVGYGFECDWWSLGVILYEMLFGFPPFCSDSRQNTKLKIVNWRQTLKFPSKPRVSPEAKHLIQSLICDHSDRLGRNGADEVKAHPFFRSIDFDTILDSTPPWKPELADPADTCYFDSFDEDNAPPSVTATPKQGTAAAAAGAQSSPAGGAAAAAATSGALSPSDTPDEFAFYGFTHRGFYNLTRKEAQSGTTTTRDGKKMDALQAAVLAQLAKDNVLDDIEKNGL